MPGTRARLDTRSKMPSGTEIAVFMFQVQFGMTSGEAFADQIRGQSSSLTEERRVRVDYVRSTSKPTRSAAAQSSPSPATNTNPSSSRASSAAARWIES